MSRAFVVALVGAESTGKTTLANELGRALAARGESVAVVGEALRGFCDREGRTPRRDEQAGIAAEQTRLIAEAAATHAVVVADTTALMVAVYSDFVFADRTLYPFAEAAMGDVDLTLLGALDLPWVADGLQRDGEQVREPVDRLLRAALERSGIGFETVVGQGPERLANALASIQRARAARDVR